MKYIKYIFFVFLWLGCYLGSGFQVVAQETTLSPENPPIPVKVELRNAQGLNFGSFTVGPAGGEVTIATNGFRDDHYDVILLGNEGSYAIFDVYTNPGTLIHILPIPEFTLTEGPNSGLLKLTIDPTKDINTSPAPFNGQSFITTQNPHPVIIGGTLNVPSGSGDFPGNYSGSFTITLIHE